MDITPRISATASVIQSYANGQFKISGRVYDTPVIVLPDTVLPWDGVDLQSAQAVSVLQASLAQLPIPADVVLIGTGGRLPSVLPHWVRQARQLFGVPMDMMDTQAACRTFNVLLTEGRRVAALLMPV